MTSNASYSGPCRDRRFCPCFAPAAACLLGLLLAVAGVAHGVHALRRDTDARMDRIVATIAGEADRLDSDIHAAHRRVADLSRALDAERSARKAEILAHDGHRKADIARLDARIADALTRDVVELGNVVMDTLRRLDRAEKRIALLAASCSCTADRPVPAPTPAPVPTPVPTPTPPMKTPTPPGKTLPAAVPPATR